MGVLEVGQNRGHTYCLAIKSDYSKIRCVDTTTFFRGGQKTVLDWHTVFLNARFDFAEKSREGTLFDGHLGGRPEKGGHLCSARPPEPLYHDRLKVMQDYLSGAHLHMAQLCPLVHCLGHLQQSTM